MWFGSDKAAYPVNDVAASTAVILNLTTSNAGFEGAAITGLMSAMASPDISKDLRQTYQLAASVMHAVKKGQDPQTIIEATLEFSKMANDNKDNKQAVAIYNEFMLEEDMGAVGGVAGSALPENILDTVQRIKQLKNSNRGQEAAFYEQQLLGQIVKGVLSGKPKDEIRNDIQAYEDGNVRPYAGSLRQISENQVTFIHPDVYNENVDPEYERRGFFGSHFFNPISELPSLGGKTGARRIAEYTHASVIAHAVTNYELSNIQAIEGDMDYGFGRLQGEDPVAYTPPLGGRGLVEAYPRKDGVKLTTEQIQEALFLGFNNNKYYSQRGMLGGGKGTGLPITQVRGTTYRTEVDEYDRAIEKEYYVLELYNARTLKYEPLTDNSGKDVLVPVDAINSKIRSAVLEDVNANPFDMTMGDVFGSATASQKRVWRIFNK